MKSKTNVITVTDIKAGFDDILEILIIKRTIHLGGQKKGGIRQVP